jgi:Rieske Fe-S protein
MKVAGVSGTCTHCGCQIFWDGYEWIDNSGGDVCGWDGGNEPHEDILD